MPESINVAALPYDKVRVIEKAVGYPMQRWGDALENGDLSSIELSAYVLAAHHDEPVETYFKWSPEKILAAVSLGDDDPQTPDEP